MLIILFLRNRKNNLVLFCMKTKWILLACTCVGCLSCSNPANEDIPGTDLSTRDRAAITILARHFSERDIDSITAAPTVYYGFVVVPQPYRDNDFTGTVIFDSVYTDSDKISYQSLNFYNRNWYAYSNYGLLPSEMVFVDNWYSSPGYFNTQIKTVFKIDTLTIIATMDTGESKMAVAGYLNTLFAIQADSADTNHNKIPEGFSMAKVSYINSSIYQDTTTLNLNCGDIVNSYQFRFFAEDFVDARQLFIIYCAVP
jgi:hypothetical protein